jgi:hypothetical protein
MGTGATFYSPQLSSKTWFRQRNVFKKHLQSE